MLGIPRELAEMAMDTLLPWYVVRVFSCGIYGKCLYDGRLRWLTRASTGTRNRRVFIAFNGKVWDPDHVKKNLEDLRFEQTF